MEIKIKYHDNELEEIKKIEQGDWIDLRSRINYTGAKGDYVEIPLGVSMLLPEGYEAHVVPRSSSFKKFGFIQTNGVGIIDESYCGDNDEWKLPVYFVRDGIINKGDRICQFRIIQKMKNISFMKCNTIGKQNRGGLGTTGTI